MLRRIVGWLVLVPLSLVLIVFALANRQSTTVNFNPFMAPPAETPPGSGVPLFLVIFGVLLAGVVLGGIAGWFAQGPVRRDRRRLQRETERLSRQLEAQHHGRGPVRNNPNLAEIDDLMDSN